MGVQDLLQLLGQEINDAEEETFLLFSRVIPSQTLGFVDSKATTLEVTIGNREFVIHQSPTLLSSNRDRGTTGAVLWKISPLFAEWISSPDNVLFHESVLAPESLVLEVGCGVSGLVGLALAPRVGRYIATDQDYVLKILRRNLEENALSSKPPRARKRGGKSTSIGASPAVASTTIEAMLLDWEESSVISLPGVLGQNGLSNFDAVVACDCIYNELLIGPFVRTCSELCRLGNGLEHGRPTVCLVAQQLRSPEVFEAWLAEFHEVFRTWRIPDELLIDDLKNNPGFVIHLGILRDA